MRTSDTGRRRVKTMGFWVLACLLSMAACAADEKPAYARAQARSGSASALAEYVFLHQTRYDGVSGDASATLGTCYERKLHTAQPDAAK